MIKKNLVLMLKKLLIMLQKTLLITTTNIKINHYLRLYLN